MKTKPVIRSKVEIRNNEIFLDGSSFYKGETGLDLQQFLVAAYKSMELNYGKFYKMDLLSKLAFLTSEVLLENIAEKSENTAIVVCNSNSSLDTDVKYFDTVSDKENYFPSPSLFVYTLPNILMGEISIRNKFKGENAFFIFDEFEYRFVSDYVNLLFKTKDIDACITGWVDVSNDNFESFLYFIERGEETDTRHLLIPENLKK